MKILYIANIRLPTEKAHGVQIMKMCEAFAQAGAEVTLVIPVTRSREDVFAAYGLLRNFEIARLPALRFPLWIPGAFVFNSLLFAGTARRWLKRQPGQSMVYTRGEMAVLLARLPQRFSLVWETHIKPEHPKRYRIAAKHAVAVIAVTSHYAEEIPKIWGVAQEHVLCAPDGVALDSYAQLPDKEAARRELHLPQEKKIVLYSGTDLPWKGLSLLREASDFLPEKVCTVFVGAIQEMGAITPRRLFVGLRPHPEMPIWTAAADVLVLTGDPHSKTARYYTSPLKLFEYMAAERPIVATDLPATREILSEEISYLAEPTPRGLARAIMAALDNPDDAAARASRARQLVERYSWVARARAILEFINKRPL